MHGAPLRTVHTESESYSAWGWVLVIPMHSPHHNQGAICSCLGHVGHMSQYMALWGHMGLCRGCEAAWSHVELYGAK